VPAVFAATILACMVALGRWVRRRSFRDIEVADQFFAVLRRSMLSPLGLLLREPGVPGAIPARPHGAMPGPTIHVHGADMWLSIRSTASFRSSPVCRWLRWQVLCLIQFMAEFQVTRLLRVELRRRHQEDRPAHSRASGEAPRASVRVGDTAVLEPAINFYRRLYKLDWMQPVTRDTPDGSYDYYVLTEQDTPLIEKLGLTVLFVDAGCALRLPCPEGAFRRRDGIPP